MRVARLTLSLSGLLVVFAAAMSFVTYGVYVDIWWWSVVGVGVVAAFAALGGLLVPRSLVRLTGARQRTARAVLGVFGSLYASAFFIMALITWTLGSRTPALHASNGYQVLGLLIFLGLIGIGIMGPVAAVGGLLWVTNRPGGETGRPQGSGHGA